MNGDVVPVVDVFFFGLYEFEFLLGIVDERAEFAYFGFTKCVSIEFVHFALDVSRCVFQHVLECFVLAVNVGEEVLSAFGQVQDGLQVDDFGAGFGDCRERLGQQLQIVHVFFDVVTHGFLGLNKVLLLYN